MRISGSFDHSEITLRMVTWPVGTYSDEPPNVHVCFDSKFSGSSCRVVNLLNLGT